MNHSQWDWNAGTKVIADCNRWCDMFEWIEEPYVSPDGEVITAIVVQEFGQRPIAVN